MCTPIPVFTSVPWGEVDEYLIGFLVNFLREHLIKCAAIDEKGHFDSCGRISVDEFR